MMKYQATCPDGWKSKVVEAADKTAAAPMLEMELEEHLKTTHQMDLPTDEAEKLKAVEDHLTQVM